MKLIVNVDANWAIGKDNRLLMRIPEDMRFFKEQTIGKVVVMGRKTLESFPGGKPLEGRVNIVLTRDPDYDAKGVTIVHSEDELKEVLKQYDDDDIFIIGGASIYEQFEPWCDTAHVTQMDYRYDADAYFPDLDAHPHWEKTFEGEEMTCFDIIYHHTVYERVGIK